MKLVSSNGIHNESRTQRFWMVDKSLQYTRVQSYYLGQETSKLLVNSLSVWHIIRVYLELIPTYQRIVNCKVSTKFQRNDDPRLSCSLHSHSNLHHTVQARRKPFSSLLLLLLLLLLLWVRVHSSPATTEGFFVSPRPLSLAPSSAHTHTHTHTHTPLRMTLCYSFLALRGEDIPFLAY